MLKLIFHTLRVLLILLLPFIVLIRGSVFFHENYQFLPYPSLFGGIVLTSIVLLLYLTIAFGKISGKVGGPKAFKNRWIVVLILIGGFAIHGLFFLSTDNTKHQEVQKEFQNLHPILRIGVSSLIWFDKKLVITDASRKPEDYKSMGLKTARQSLHYKQKDGFVYAIDLRTNNRSALRNDIIKTYFTLMGFNTLRHVGTGDHLHVSLSCKFKPGGI